MKLILSTVHKINFLLLKIIYAYIYIYNKNIKYIFGSIRFFGSVRFVPVSDRFSVRGFKNLRNRSGIFIFSVRSGSVLHFSVLFRFRSGSVRLSGAVRVILRSVLSLSFYFVSIKIFDANRNILLFS